MAAFFENGDEPSGSIKWGDSFTSWMISNCSRILQEGVRWTNWIQWSLSQKTNQLRSDDMLISKLTYRWNWTFYWRQLFTECAGKTYLLCPNHQIRSWLSDIISTYWTGVKMNSCARFRVGDVCYCTIFGQEMPLQADQFRLSFWLDLPSFLWKVLLSP